MNDNSEDNVYALKMKKYELDKTQDEFLLTLQENRKTMDALKDCADKLKEHADKTVKHIEDTMKAEKELDERIAINAEIAAKMSSVSDKPSVAELIALREEIKKLRNKT